MDRIKNIEKMQKIMDKHEKLLEKLNKVLDEYEAHQDEYHEFSQYYSSKQWFLDNEAYMNHELPEDMNVGILSEDAAYDVIGEQFNTAVRLIKVANDVLQEHTNIEYDFDEE